MTDLSNIKVLIVDDNQNDRFLTQRCLREIGMLKFASAEDGEQALTVLHREIDPPGTPFHIVLTDRDMPGMNGEDLVVNLRHDALTEHLPIAMISGSIDTGLKKFLQDARVLHLDKSRLDNGSLQQLIMDALEKWPK